MPYFTAAVLALLSWTFSALCIKYFMTRSRNNKSILLYSLSALAVAALWVLIFGIGHETFLTIALSAVGGVVSGAFYILIFRSYETEQVSNIAILSVLQAAIIAIFALFVLGERVSTLSALLIVGIIFGVALSTFDMSRGFHKGLIPASAAYVLGALYWLLLSSAITISGSFTLPFLITKAISLVIVVAYYLKRPQFGINRNRKRSMAFTYALLLGLAGGALDTLGSVAFGFTIKASILAVGAAITALEPLLVAIIALELYRDRLDLVQVLGIGIAIACAVALALA